MDNIIFKWSYLKIVIGIAALTLLLLADNAASRTLTVDANGIADYTRIQDAINNSGAGDIILVNSGTYYEKVDVNKQLNLNGIDTGEGRPVVNTNGNDSAITLNADRVTLEGFTAVNSYKIWPNSGIRVNSNNNILKNNIVSNNYYGINISYSPPNPGSNGSIGGNTLSDNTASGNEKGIFLYNSNGNILINNILSENKYNFGAFALSSSFFDNNINTSNLVNGRPIYYIKGALDTVFDSSTNAGTFYCIDCINVTIKDMDLNANAIGVYFWNTNISRVQNVNLSNNRDGITLTNSKNNTINDNNILNNNDNGITLGSSSDNIVTNNTISNNSEGVYLFSYPVSVHTRLPFESSPLGIGVSMPYSTNNTIYNNIFNNIDNTKVLPVTSVRWNITKQQGKNIIGGLYLGGNSWINQNGTGFSQTCSDTDNDGICDSSYIFDNYNNTDYLPLAYRPLSILKGDLNNNGMPADANDLVLMKRASTGEIQFQTWPIPADKYVFIERWTNITLGPEGPIILIDFPTYIFDEDSGTLKPFIVPPGKWFPLEDLADLKMVLGTGTSLRGEGGGGIASGVSAITQLPYQLPYTEGIVTIERVDAHGIVYLMREEKQLVIKPGESWITQGTVNSPNSTKISSSF